MLKKMLLAVAGFFAAIGVAFAAVDVNTADRAALDTIKGIGPVTADKIIAERGKGKFKDWDDLIKRVDGVGDNNAVNFSGAGLTVGGASFKGAAPKAANKTTEKPTADKGKSEKPTAAAATTKEAAKSDKPSKEAAAVKTEAPTKEAKEAAPTKAEKAAAAKQEKAEKAEAAKKAKAEKAAAKKAAKEAAKEAPTKDAGKAEKPKQ